MSNPRRVTIALRRRQEILPPVSDPPIAFARFLTLNVLIGAKPQAQLMRDDRTTISAFRSFYPFPIDAFTAVLEGGEGEGTSLILILSDIN